MQFNRTDFKEHGFNIKSINLSDDGNNLITTSNSHTAQIWDKNGNLLLKLEYYFGQLFDAYFSKDGKKAVTSGTDSTKVVVVWDTNTGKSLVNVSAQPWKHYSVGHFHPNGKYVVVWHKHESRALLYPIDCTDSYKQITADINIAYNPNNYDILTIHHPNKLVIYNQYGCQKISLLLNIQPRFFGYSPNGEYIVITTEDNKLYLYRNPRNNIELEEFAKNPNSFIMAVFMGYTKPVSDFIFSSDMTKLATTDYSGNTKVWDLATAQQLFNLKPYENNRQSSHWPTFFCNDKYLISTDYTGTYYFWDMATGKQIYQLGYYKNYDIKLLKIMPDDRSIITAGKEWETYLGKYKDIATIWHLANE